MIERCGQVVIPFENARLRRQQNGAEDDNARTVKTEKGENAAKNVRINTDNSHHRYDILLIINVIPAAQIELKTLGINPRRAIKQIIDYKNDPGNGYTRTQLPFEERTSGCSWLHP